MSAHEVWVRTAQEMNKRVDAACAKLGFSPLKQPVTRAPKPPGRFFFDSNDVPVLIERIRATLPEDAGRIVRDAERICERRFDLLGYEGLDFGREIDWHFDPVNNRRAPRTLWFRIPFLDFDTVGDHKVIWELNRHQHLVTLARAFLLAGETRYLEELQAQWHSWQSANPYPYGINWASSLEVAFRCLSWIWIDHLLAGRGLDKFRAVLAPAIAGHARYIAKYLSYYFAPNTHLLGEAVALYFAGTLYPQFAAAARWRRLGWRIVQNEAARQVLPDGAHFEQSTYYHVYALDMFLHARLLAARNCEEAPSEFDAVIERMAEALRAQSQAGAAPRFGDDDGGRWFDPRRNRTEHMLDPLAT
ncbi:MAG TPA: heparinase II/III family protein, partial [Bryobacteraceae bacterium]|nr:heparinase II/III family protein [Bryobacteraceae bacterium]